MTNNIIENLPSIQLTSRQKDLTGEKCGNSVYLKPSRKDGYRTFWWMQCECGEIYEKRADHVKSLCPVCSAKQKSKKLMGQGIKDLTGQRFEYLEVLFQQQERKNNMVIWHCRCKCGNEVDVSTSSLTSGNTKSCGCLRKEKANFHSLKLNLVGERFGNLVVIEETEMRQYGKVVWKCRCNCGNIVYLNTSRLKGGNDISCGCQKESFGVQNIKNILNSNNLTYIQEYCLTDLNNYRFDFAILEDNKIIRLIEFDGEQHFRKTGGWNNQENFDKIQQRDKIKNEYALSNNIPLVRIPYWERDKITLEMILGDQYLIK